MLPRSSNAMIILCFISILLTLARHFSNPLASTDFTYMQRKIATAFKNSQLTPRENKRIPVMPENRRPKRTKKARVIQHISTLL